MVKTPKATICPNLNICVEMPCEIYHEYIGRAIVNNQAGCAVTSNAQAALAVAKNRFQPKTKERKTGAGLATGHI